MRWYFLGDEISVLARNQLRKAEDGINFFGRNYMVFEYSKKTWIHYFLGLKSWGPNNLLKIWKCQFLLFRYCYPSLWWIYSSLWVLRIMRVCVSIFQAIFDPPSLPTCQQMSNIKSFNIFEINLVPTQYMCPNIGCSKLTGSFYKLGLSCAKLSKASASYH